MPSCIYNSLSRDTAAVADALNVMMQKEQIFYKSHRNYLDPSFPGDTKITESDRMEIVEWCYSIIDKCQLSRETVAIAMEMVDRFASKESNSDMLLYNHTLFQLLAMAALYSSIKTNERIAFSSDFFAIMSRGEYSVDEIEAMELIMLNGLSWRIVAPTSIQMAHHILSLLLPHVIIEESTWGFILDEVRYQTECAVKHIYFTTQRPSTVAIAAIFNTLEQVNKQDRWDMFDALLLVMNEDFASPDQILAAKNRLQYHVKCNDSIEDTVLSKTSRELPALSLTTGQI
mmetsp:Transcript_7718/g.17451  ORF Transcript_7718/g.17451 Transcript_7718/m.17451 type:complete len:287 (+) Transcript_7718:112-972(+)|eukprot:CAMPEP_0172299104 /NCGR_PEP_ID=MMETSP1058-20130122/1484_1 /TAXON_ID=83371 /ORGANISM="Detonula confervacea, Strain CCMP 353" /LENGTH=286 /DNA_ID=CAMNT_0013008435 /DNA_START=19 /DNA_END=879 /DNA_ORIENTATION=-